MIKSSWRALQTPEENATVLPVRRFSRVVALQRKVMILYHSGKPETQLL